MATTENETDGKGPYPAAGVALSMEEKRREREELQELLGDIEAGTEPEWESVVVPAWRNRTVWVRGLTTGERAKLRKDGYRQVKDAEGEPMLQETGELEALLVQMACHYVGADNRKRRIFKDGADQRVLIKRQIGGNLDEVVQVALRLSGLTKNAKEEAKEAFLDTRTDGFDSGSPETWE